MKSIDETNPFSGYLEKLKDKCKEEGKKLNPVHEVVNEYYKINGFENKPRYFYKGRYGYGKLAKEAKELLLNCKGDLEDALWSLDKMKYKAERGDFDWTIRTCLKHDLS